jgi:ribonucrease Y
MLTTLLIVTAAAIISGLVGFFVAKKLDSAKYQIYIEQSKSKARAIEHEAELKLEGIKAKEVNLELDSRKKLELELSKMKSEYDTKQHLLAKKEESLSEKVKSELSSLDGQKKEITSIRQELIGGKEELDKLKKSYDAKLQEALKIAEAGAGLTKSEAREIVLAKTEELCREDIAHIVRRLEAEAKADARKRANYIIAQATTRFAGEFAAERLINVVPIQGEELKGRIIGKEGRNIKVLEMLLGVDIIIDDTPNAIIVSSFNLLRRAIATKTIELLIEDGRIQPAKIEEIYEKVKLEFDEKMYEEGENIVMDLGVGPMNPELIKLIGRLKYRASYGQNALAHTLEVVHLAGIIAAELGGDEVLAKRAGLLHDIGKALTHDYSGSHVDLGADVCKRYKEHPIVINAIYAHHGLEEVKSIECAAVCTGDALSAARPGARREVLESFLKRVEELEKIALSHNGVKNAYAIAAGKEIRVIVNASLINDDESALIAREIAKEVEKGVQYPGEIKVSVIRETRTIEFAR